VHRFADQNHRKPQELVTIIACTPEGKHEFTVCKEIICKSSPFFAAAFNGRFLEGRTHSMIMPKVEPEVLSLLIEWVNSKSLHIERLDGPHKSTIDFDNKFDALLSLAKLWLLGQLALMPSLQNAVMDKLGVELRDSSKSVIFDLALWVYDHDETQGSKLRLKMSYCMAWMVPRSLIRSYQESLPRDLLLDLVMEFCNAAPIVLPQGLDSRAKYHVPEAEKSAG
jgi:hypothetical protein